MSIKEYAKKNNPSEKKKKIGLKIGAVISAGFLTFLGLKKADPNITINDVNGAKRIFASALIKDKAKLTVAYTHLNNFWNFQKKLDGLIKKLQKSRDSRDLDRVQHYYDKGLYPELVKLQEFIEKNLNKLTEPQKNELLAQLNEIFQYIKSLEAAEFDTGDKWNPKKMAVLKSIKRIKLMMALLGVKI